MVIEDGLSRDSILKYSWGVAKLKEMIYLLKAVIKLFTLLEYLWLFCISIKVKNKIIAGE